MTRRPPGAFGALRRLADRAALLGGLGWLLLAPAAELVRRNLLSYDGYNRLLAVPLVLFTVALALASRRSVWGRDRGLRAGLPSAQGCCCSAISSSSRASFYKMT